MPRSIIVLVLAFLTLLFFTTFSYPQSASHGTIKGYVVLPNRIDIAHVPNEATLYIYLKDHTPQDGKEIPPWEAPIKKVIDFKINSLRSYEVAFEFSDLPKGIYGVSVLIDTGRPHVPYGSLNFTAYPGDYAGGIEENIKLEADQTVEVSIKEGLYVTIPNGYDAPLYSPE